MGFRRIPKFIHPRWVILSHPGWINLICNKSPCNIFSFFKKSEQNEKMSVQFRYRMFIFLLMYFIDKLKITIVFFILIWNAFFIKFNYFWGNYQAIDFIVSTSNHMFGTSIWGKLTESIWKFWNYPSKTKTISKFSKMTRVTYPKNCPNQTCGYWLITPNQQTICIEINFF